MAEGVFATHLANNYMNDKGGIEESLINGGDTGVGQTPPSAYGQDSGQGLSPGMKESYDRIKGQIPKVQLPQDGIKSVPQGKPEKGYIGELTGKTADKLIEGGVARAVAIANRVPAPQANWVGLGTAALTTLKDHWQEIPGMVESIPSPKSFPANCDGITCDRQD